MATQPTASYAIGHTLGKHWRWVLGGIVILAVSSYFYEEYQLAEARRVEAVEQTARAAREEKARIAQAAAAASAEAAKAAAEAAKTPLQRTAEKRAAERAERAEKERVESLIKLSAKLSAMKWWDRCRAWGREVRSGRQSPWRDALKDDLMSDGYLNHKDLANVSDRAPAVGMTTCGVYAQLGIPDAANATTTARSTTVQLVYRERGMYVYTRAEPNNGNGIVDAVQH